VGALAVRRRVLRLHISSPCKLKHVRPFAARHDLLRARVSHQLRSGAGCAATTSGFSLSRPSRYYGKIAVHPVPIATWGAPVGAHRGPLPGELMVVCGALFYGGLVALAIFTFLLDRTKHKDRHAPVAMG
jgi:hypothetical protein